MRNKNQTVRRERQVELMEDIRLKLIVTGIMDWQWLKS